MLSISARHISKFESPEDPILTLSTLVKLMSLLSNSANFCFLPGPKNNKQNKYISYIVLQNKKHHILHI